MRTIFILIGDLIQSDQNREILIDLIINSNNGIKWNIHLSNAIRIETKHKVYADALVFVMNIAYEKIYI